MTKQKCIATCNDYYSMVLISANVNQNITYNPQQTFILILTADLQTDFQDCPGISYWLSAESPHAHQDLVSQFDHPDKNFHGTRARYTNDLTNPFNYEHWSDKLKHFKHSLTDLESEV